MKRRNMKKKLKTEKYLDGIVTEFSDGTVTGSNTPQPDDMETRFYAMKGLFTFKEDKTAYSGFSVIFDAPRVLKFIRSERSLAFKEGEKSERKRIAKAMQPAFDDFTKAGKLLIQTKGFKDSGNEVIENIGYMKSILVDIDSLK